MTFYMRFLFLFCTLGLAITSANLYGTDSNKKPKVSPTAEKSQKNKITQEDAIKRGDPRAHLKIFSSMNEESGAGSHGAWEDDLDISNPTPIYIKPLGDYPNSIEPAYKTVPQKAWIYNPEEDRIPEQLKKAMRGEPVEPTAEQLKQQEFNKGVYIEPKHPFNKSVDESKNSKKADKKAIIRTPKNKSTGKDMDNPNKVSK